MTGAFCQPVLILIINLGTISYLGLKNTLPCIKNYKKISKQTEKRTFYLLFAPRYIEDYEDIKMYFAAFHLHEKFPSAVIIDDFGGFFNDRYEHDYI